MSILRIIKTQLPHRHKLKIVDCKINHNGRKQYGVICRRCLTIVGAGLSLEEAHEIIKVIKTGSS